MRRSRRRSRCSDRCGSRCTRSGGFDEAPAITAAVVARAGGGGVFVASGDRGRVRDEPRRGGAVPGVRGGRGSGGGVRGAAGGDRGGAGGGVLSDLATARDP